MIKAFKGRELVEGEKVHCHRNLRENAFSVVHGGHVVAHGERIVLQDVTFTVRPSGLARVRAEGVKNVHAFVSGTYRGVTHCTTEQELTELGYREAYYNPEKTETFIDRASGCPIAACTVAILVNNKVYYY